MSEHLVIPPELAQAISKDPRNVQRLLDLVTQAAQLGAENALQQVGLGEHLSADDVKELGELLKGWRDFKGAVLRELGRWVIRGLLLLLVIAGAKQIPTFFLRP